MLKLTFRAAVCLPISLFLSIRWHFHCLILLSNIVFFSFGFLFLLRFAAFFFSLLLNFFIMCMAYGLWHNTILRCYSCCLVVVAVSTPVHIYIYIYIYFVHWDDGCTFGWFFFLFSFSSCCHSFNLIFHSVIVFFFLWILLK